MQATDSRQKCRFAAGLPVVHSMVDVQKLDLL